MFYAYKCICAVVGIIVIIILIVIVVKRKSRKPAYTLDMKMGKMQNDYSGECLSLNVALCIHVLTAVSNMCHIFK